MSTATLGVSRSIDGAVRRAFSEASVRVHPDARMTDIIAALTALGVTVEITDGVLVLRQGETQMNTTLALRNFSKRPESEKFFVLAGAHPKTWSHEQKVAYLRTHSESEYRALIQAPVLEAGIRTMDPNMSKSDYMQLTRGEKIQFIREFGDGAVSKIFQKAR